ncbi:MAG: potassium/proton antiporter [Rhizobiales bacterium]|nr:potassium/proton antiporter [Hyphomicrobiales bacterium]
MAALEIVNLTVLLGAVIVLAGILSSLVALRFGAPLLLIFLLIGVFAGESGPGGIKFNDVGIAFTVGSIALALILFDGGLRTRFQAFKNVLAPAGLLATVGVLVTAALVAPVAFFALDLSWTESLLVGAVIGSTDAAAVFFLIHTRGLRLRPRIAATLEVESGTNDPFAIFLTIILVEILAQGHGSWGEAAAELSVRALVGLALGLLGGQAVVGVMNRLGLPQGLHAPFVATAALVIFAATEATHGSGYLAAYVAGMIVGNRPTRAHNAIITFLDAVTWLAQIVMFVILGLLVWPERLLSSLVPALFVAFALTFIARPAAVFLCLWPFRYAWREKIFISWVGLRGAVGIFLASIPLLVGMPKAYIYFDVAFVVVLVSLLVQGWTLTPAARRLQVALPRSDAAPQRVELDLPGQTTHELVGYAVGANSLFLRRHVLPTWAKLALLVRDERVLSPLEGGAVRENDYVYFLAPLEKARALDRFFVDMPAPSAPDARLLGGFQVSADVTLGALAEIYGLSISEEDATLPLAEWFDQQFDDTPTEGDRLPLGAIEVVADRVVDGKVVTVGLDLADEPETPPGPLTWSGRLRAAVKPLISGLGLG